MRRWCQNRGRPEGGVVPLELAWRLSKLWYADRLSLEWRRRTVAETQAIFADLGLTGAFWQLVEQA